jgi:hypothetical protein
MHTHSYRHRDILLYTYTSWWWITTTTRHVHKTLWPRAIDQSLLKRHYNGSLVAMGHRYPSLLLLIVAMDVLTSAHPLLLDRKHSLHLIYKRRHNLLITAFIKFIQRVHASGNIYTYIDRFIHQVQQNLNRRIEFNKS